ncbi:rhomboid family intramembrane serine protease [Lapillicoccus jejuensis]|uniref:Membrane associated rhomboid family serine protease n=1 Tax=Lapillicoccus jejuensis TaxID=402171 RepID=A0A542DZ02_9MICO|nr:rhomboid family intramembrane serine protease [Lapillicoccus jejuensis]TQJ08322.1 membrane associated rhomboid family serine protease [Lapillicoccus jejuensis]
MTQQPLPPQETTVPVCPRHPDRESRTRCQRCGRPACWECQRPAAVGFQCVDCVREQARESRPTVTVLGGRAASDGRPLVTMTIIALCVLGYLLQTARPAITEQLDFVPAYGAAEPWRTLTSAFLHVNLLHLGTNMLSLWFIGPYVESLLGRARFVAVYALSAFGGSLGLLLLTPAPGIDASQAQVAAWYTAAVGASGAISGVFLALVILNRHLGRATAGVGFVIMLNVALPLILHGIAWQAHLGGAVTGVVAAALLTALRPAARQRWVWPALAGLGLVLVGAYVGVYASAGLV